MIKLHCDRCGKEIKDKYYSIGTMCHYLDATKEINNYDHVSEMTYVPNRPSLDPAYESFRILNSEKMYCEECKDEFERFMSSKLVNVTIQ